MPENIPPEKEVTRATAPRTGEDDLGSAINSFEAMEADLLQFKDDKDIPPQMFGYLARWAHVFVKHHGETVKAALAAQKRGG
jgi:hypothetical protein